MNQAQSRLDQLPMDMGEEKQELETERREYGDKVRQGMETARERETPTATRGITHGRTQKASSRTQDSITQHD